MAGQQLERREVLDSTVVFSELMYHPRGSEELEWVELHNLMAVDMDLSQWRIEGIDYTFAEGTILAAGGYLLVVWGLGAWYWSDKEAALATVCRTVAHIGIVPVFCM